MKGAAKVRDRSAGFTLIESLIAIVVLMILMAGVFALINKAQMSYRVESQKVDLTQEQREFIDQFTRDLHQAGYPTPASLGLATPPTGVSGLTGTFSSTDVTMQGDLGDGTGVHTIRYVYNPNPTPCQCVQRIVDGTAYTVLENVAAPNAQEIFTAYDSNGQALTVPIAPLSSIKSIRVSVTVQRGRESDNKTPIQVTMTGMARLPNHD